VIFLINERIFNHLMYPFKRFLGPVMKIVVCIDSKIENYL